MTAPRSVRLQVNGQSVEVPDGSSVAAAVAQITPARCRDSVRGTPRAPLCGMGVCFECRVCIDGREQQRACMTPVHEGMQVNTHG